MTETKPSTPNPANSFQRIAECVDEIRSLGDRISSLEAGDHPASKDVVAATKALSEASRATTQALAEKEAAKKVCQEARGKYQKLVEVEAEAIHRAQQAQAAWDALNIEGLKAQLNQKQQELLRGVSGSPAVTSPPAPVDPATTVGTAWYSRFEQGLFQETVYLIVEEPYVCQGYNEMGEVQRRQTYSDATLKGGYTTSLTQAEATGLPYQKRMSRNFWPEGFHYPEEGEPLVFLFRVADAIIVSRLGQGLPLTDGDYQTVTLKKVPNSKGGLSSRRVREMLPGLGYRIPGVDPGTNPTGIPQAVIAKRLEIHSYRPKLALFQRTTTLTNHPFGGEWQLTPLGVQVYERFKAEGKKP